MKRYIKDNDIKFSNEIIVRKDGAQTINPSEEQIIEDGWVEYVTPEPTEEEKEITRKHHEVRRIKDMLSNSDYKVIKCIEAYLCGEEMPYDINSLHAERQALRDEINAL